MDRWEDSPEAGGQRPPDKLFPEDMSSGNMTSRRIYPPESRSQEDAVLREPNQSCFFIDILITFVSNPKT